MQRIDINEISYYARATCNNTVYVSNLKSNGLYRLDNGVYKLLGRFNNAAENAIALHSFAYTIGDEIWFFPLFGKYISIFNSRDNTLISYEIWPWYNSANSYMSHGVINNMDSLILIPGDTRRKAIQIDKRTRKMRPVNLNERIAFQYDNSTDLKPIMVCNCEDTTIIYFTDTSIILEVKNSDLSVIRYDLGPDMKTKRITSCKGRTMIIACDAIFEWSGDNAVHIFDFQKSFSNKSSLIASLFENVLLVYEPHSDVLVAVDVATGVQQYFTCPSIPGDSANEINSWTHYWGLFGEENGAVLAPVGSRCELHYDFYSKDLKQLLIKIDNEEFNNTLVYNKSEQNFLSEYIQYVIDM